MDFSKIIRRKNKLLKPLSWLYAVGVAARHTLYDRGWKSSYTPEIPAICVGNLSVGGTGKTPMIEYLLSLFSSQMKTAVISRGYKRKSTGILIADHTSSAQEIGDEPMQFHKKFPKAKIVVGAQRAAAIRLLMKKFPDTELILLDDALQHRAVNAGLNILLTAFDNLFTNDLLLPAGQLRDLKSSHKRADIIVVTKSPENLSVQEAKRIVAAIRPMAHQSVLFATLQYGTLFHIFNGMKTSFANQTFALLVTGIAQPTPIEEYLKRHDIGYKQMRFPDHHRFSQNDAMQIRHLFQNIKKENKIIITTEKDAVRLYAYQAVLAGLPVYALPVQHRFLFGEGEKFETLVRHFIISSKNKS